MPKATFGRHAVKRTSIAVLAAVLVLSACADADDDPQDEAAPADAEPGTDDDGDSNEYPNQPIELVVPYSAGGGTDAMARAFATVAAKHMDRPFRNIAMPGSGGATGTVYVVDSEPDGYTVSFGTTGSLITVPLLEDDAGYEVEDLDLVGIVSEAALVFLVGSDSEWEDFESLVEYSRENPGTVSYGTAGAGGSAHTTVEAMQDVLEVEWSHVPFDGSADAVLAAMGGHVDVAIPSLGTVVEQLNSGDVTPLVVSTQEPVGTFPEIPTFYDLGYEFDYTIWYAFAVPNGTPEHIHEYLADLAETVVEDEEFVTLATGIEGVPPRFTEGAQATERRDALIDRLEPVLERLQ